MILLIKHISIEGPGLIAEFFRNSSWKLKTIELDKGDKLPEDLSEIEAVTILGGPMNVDEEDKFPFLKDEDIFLKEAIKKEIPILGICLGAQLLAKACGARVKKAKTEEIGWYKLSLTEEGKADPLFKNASGELDVFQWHQDIFELPEKAKLLAASALCQNQAFRLGKNTYGLQFHIEVTPGMVESWIKEYVDNQDQSKTINTQKMITDTYKKKRQFTKQANIIFLNFSRLIAEKTIAVS